MTDADWLRFAAVGLHLAAVNDIFAIILFPFPSAAVVNRPQVLAH